MILFLALLALAALLVCGGLAVLGLCYFLRTLCAGWGVWGWAKRIGFIGAGIAVIASPCLVVAGLDYAFALRRVPAPLHVARIEYRTEKLWGVGPSGRETGFVVYRLTDGSAAWARSKGAQLGEDLPAERRWKRTPVDDKVDGGDRWHPYDGEFSKLETRHGPNISEYLDRFGFGIPIDRPYADDFNRVIQSHGSFYTYGSAGSLMVVDPRGQKVYFAYVG